MVLQTSAAAFALRGDTAFVTTQLVPPFVLAAAAATAESSASRLSATPALAVAPAAATAALPSWAESWAAALRSDVGGCCGPTAGLLPAAEPLPQRQRRRPSAAARAAEAYRQMLGLEQKNSAGKYSGVVLNKTSW
eukprot:TRINITY_DN64442_c0_g1_i1.p1 TRINITY_DN64442_c0_g1~~TRINITY_DN64442_c0_g1_i1.p1  ORF type:complete len:157 (-),score=41.90 TRINITY_DN64442_c0_g1_i1:335-742(-)